MVHDLWCGCVMMGWVVAVVVKWCDHGPGCHQCYSGGRFGSISFCSGDAMGWRWLSTPTVLPLLWRDGWCLSICIALVGRPSIHRV